MNNKMLVVIILLLLVIVGVVYHSYLMNKKFTDEAILNLVENFQGDKFITELSNLESELQTLIGDNNGVFDKTLMDDFLKKIQNIITFYSNPLNKEKYKFQIDQALQDDNLKKLQTEYDVLKKQIGDIQVNDKIYSISNPNFGYKLNVEPIVVEEEEEENKNSFNVYINKGCLQVSKTEDPETKETILLPEINKMCSPNDNKQLFRATQIKTLGEYNGALKKNEKGDPLKQHKITANMLKYVPTPFYVINPIDNDSKDECLTIDSNKNISVEPCNLGKYQRWNISNKHSSC